MRKTDYSRIADKYDKNKFRQKVKPDDDLEDFIHSSGNQPWKHGELCFRDCLR